MDSKCNASIDVLPSKNQALCKYTVPIQVINN